MHDIKRIRDDEAAFDAALDRRAAGPDAPRAAALLAMDDERRRLIGEAQALQERRNAASKAIGRAMAAKDQAAADALKAEVAALKDRLAEAERAAEAAGKALDDALLAIPNAPAADVPVGADERANVERHRHGAPRREGEGLAFAPRQHFELGEAMGLMDFEAAAKMSGARFVVTKGHLARLERALGQFMLDLHTEEHEYQEVNPPLMVRGNAMKGTAQLPKFINDQFYITTISAQKMIELQANLEYQKIRLFNYGKTKENYFKSNYGDEYENFMKAHDRDMYSDILKKDIQSIEEQIEIFLASEAGAFQTAWLIPTAEVPLTNLVRESILDAAALPLRFAALTPCFRAEAGAAGRDTRGMIRQHQFTKCELVSITAPDQSEAEHERMLACAEEVLKRLGLAFRTVTLSTGDMGFAARKTYDVEVWLPGQGAYREISSCSNCGDFQARRMSARFRAAGAKGAEFVHTLNGSGVAVGRALVAVLETYQEADGSVTVPDALRPYMGGIARVGGPA